MFTSLIKSKITLLSLSGLALIAIWYSWRFIPGTAYRDDLGEIHGTGTIEYFYGSGRVRASEQYVNGQLRASEYYKPDGSLVAVSHWRGGTGVEYYLREDGSIQRIIPCKNGIAEGIAIDMPIDQPAREIVYRAGTPVE